MTSNFQGFLLLLSLFSYYFSTFDKMKSLTSKKYRRIKVVIDPKGQRYILFRKKVSFLKHLSQLPSQGTLT